MRTIEYLSPSGIKTFEESEEDFYCRYLADIKTPRDPQLLVMAVGSAFDAYVKSYLYSELRIGSDPAFERDAIFEAQVEEQNRDEARVIGEHVFAAYVKCGAAADLVVMLGECTNARFEYSLQGAIKSELLDLSNQPGGNPVLLGKPDLYFTHRDGSRVILDWKVNGYLSKKAPSPRKGYLNILPTGIGSFPRLMHKDVHPGDMGGVRINIAHQLEVVDLDWARQLGIYGWLLGEEVGGKFIVAIDQIICGERMVKGVAQHRCTIGEDFQRRLFNRIVEIWRRCNDGHFFTTLSREDSEARCRLLDQGPGPELFTERER